VQFYAPLFYAVYNCLPTTRQDKLDKNKIKITAVSVVAIMTENKFFSFNKRKSNHYMNKHA